MKKKKKILIIIFSILGILLAVGGGIGAYLIIEGNKDAVELEDSEAKYETTLIEAPTDGSLPTEHTATDVIAYSLWTVANAKQFKVVTDGEAKASVATQKVANERVVKDGCAMISTVSAGMVSVGTQRFFFPQEENKVLSHGASKISSDAVAVWDYDATPECLTYKGMKKRYGWYPFQANGYIICSDTYLNKDLIQVVDNGDGTYFIEFDLDPDGEKAPFWYRREVITSSGSTIVPEFSMIHVEFTIDSTYHILKQDIQEEYKVKSMGVEANTKTDCHDIFSYEDVEFNQEAYDYFMKYKSLEPAADSEDDSDSLVSGEDDIMTMVVSSLQKADKSDVHLALKASVGDLVDLEGNASLNISDLNNVLVKAKLGDAIYVEYVDNALYVMLGGAKYKINISDIDLSGLSSDEKDENDTAALDVNQIISDLNGGTKTQNDNNYKINTSLSLMGINLDLYFDIDKTENGYVLNEAKAETEISDMPVTISIVKTENAVSAMNHSLFNELDVKSLISNISDIINGKEMAINASLSYDDLELTVAGDLSFKESLYINLDVDISYDSYEIKLNIKLKDNVIYLQYENLSACVSVDDIKTLIADISDDNTDNDSVRIQDIHLNAILNEDLKTLVSKLQESGIDGLLEEYKSDGKLDILGLVSSLKKLDITSEEKTTSLELDFAKLNLTASVTPKKINSDFDTASYVSLETLFDKISAILPKIGKESLKVTLNGEVDLSKFIDTNLKLNLSGYADLLLNENSEYEIASYITADVSKVKLDLEVYYKNDAIYVSALGINMMIPTEKLDTIYDDICTHLGIEQKEEESSFDADTLFGILDTVQLSAEDSLSVDLTSIYEKLGVITLALIDSDRLAEVNANAAFADIHASLDVTDYYDIQLPETNVSYNNILDILDIVKKFMDIAREKSFNLNLSMNVYDDNELHLTITGSVLFTVYENGRFDISIDAEIDEYENDAIKMNHYITLTVISKEGFAYRAGVEDASSYKDMLYIEYGTNPDDLSSKLRLYTPLSDILSIVSTVSDITGLDLSFLEDYDTADFKNLDTSNIKELISSDSESETIVLNNIINDISVTEGNADILLDLSAFMNQKEDTYPELLLDMNGEDYKAKLTLTNLYTVYNSESSNTMLNMNYVSLLSEEKAITVPDTAANTWYDISGIDDLVNGVITTALNKDYQIEGTIKMTILSFINIEVPVTVKVHVNDDKTPVIYAYIDLSDISVGRLLIDAYHVYYYYEDGYVYICRYDNDSKTKSYQLKVTKEAFLDDILYYTLDFGFGMSSTVLNEIEKSSSDEDYRTDAGETVNSYSQSSSTQFDFSLSLEEMTGNSNLGDLDIGLTLSEVVTKEEEDSIKTGLALTSISNLSVSLVKIISISSTSLKLTNLASGSDGYTRFTDVNMDETHDYIDAYAYPVDIIYKDGSYNGKITHKLMFVPGMGLEVSSVEGIAGTSFKTPNYGLVTYNGVDYVLDGWYMDQSFETPCTITGIPNKNTNIYAKFVKAYSIKITTFDKTETCYYGVGADISSLYDAKLVENNGTYYTVTGYTLNGNEFTLTRMPAENIELTSVTKVITYKLYIDNLYKTDFTMDSELSITSDIDILSDGVYYSYAKEMVTPSLLFNKYSKLFVFEEDYAYINVYTHSARTGYYMVTLDYAYTKFNAKGYYAISLPENTQVSAVMLNVGSYGSYGVNYWYDADGNEYYGDILPAAADSTLKPYYATNRYLSYQLDENGDAAVSGFSYTGDAIFIILPKYVQINNQYYVLKTLMNTSTDSDYATVFTGNEYIQGIVFNEGFTTITGNAFKNAKNLTAVYFSDTMTTVATDAFYFSSEDYDDDSGYAENLKFYVTDSSAITSDTVKTWLACKYSFLFITEERYYGNSYSGLGSADLTGALNTYDGTVSYVLNYFHN